MEPGQDWKVAALTFISYVHFFDGCDFVNKDEYYMNMAFKEAMKAYSKGEVPVGTVIVLDDKIISRGYNLRETTKDITKHAELIAIKRASKKVNDWRLQNTVMYVTLFPCSMCASAIVQSRISKLVIGTKTLDQKNEKIINKIFEGNNTCPKIIVKTGVLESKCKDILSKFFCEQRLLKKEK